MQANFVPTINVNVCGFLSDSRHLVDGVMARARQELIDLDAAQPAAEPFDRQAEIDAREAVTDAQQAVDQAANVEAAAVKAGDFRKSQGAEISHRKARENLASVEKLRERIVASLDEREQAAKAARNAAARDRHKRQLQETNEKKETALRDLLASHGEDLIRVLVLESQSQILNETIANDALAVIFEEAEQLQKNQKFWAEQPEVKPDLRPSVERFDETISDVAGSCSDLDCNGPLCLEADGINRPKIVCERCGKESIDHPLLAEIV